jgi:alkaline phosphatase
MPQKRNGTLRALIAGVVVGAMAMTVLPALAGTTDGFADLIREIQPVRARNVILFLGDGMGDSEITIARNYAKGAAGELAMDTLPLSGEYTTFAVKSGTSNVPDYVTDSAASGTGWATGHKTYNNAISVDPITKRPLPTILEQAQRAGFQTGNVTTAELTDATPAVLDSHITLRGCQGPADMATCPTERKSAGGLGSIAEQTVDHKVDVLMGGGKARFDQATDAGPTVLAQAGAAGYQIATDAAGLSAATPTRPFLGLFSAGNIGLEWTGPLAAPYPGPAATACTPANPARPATEPHLADMTTKALSLLEQRSARSRNGFFLQVEGASIDKQDHASNPCGQIGETVEFDRSIAIGLEYARTHPLTLVVVTTDHGHTSQIIEAQTASDHSPGAIATLITADNQPMVVNHATNLPGRSQSHTAPRCASQPMGRVPSGSWASPTRQTSTTRSHRSWGSNRHPTEPGAAAPGGPTGLAIAAPIVGEGGGVAEDEASVRGPTSPTPRVAGSPQRPRSI